MNVNRPQPSPLLPVSPRSLALGLVLGLAAGAAGCTSSSSHNGKTGEQTAAEPTAAEPTTDQAIAATPGGAETPPASATGPEATLASPAPDFTLTDLDGNTHTLSAHRGKVVVLEWFNPGCPFVQYAHGEGPLRDLAARNVAEGVVWLAINSGADGKQGAGAETNRAAIDKWKMEYPLLLDPDGAVGRAYGATTTPNMFVIDPRGNLVYRGALDNAPLGRAPEGGIQSYVADAIAAVRRGGKVETAETKPYGCSVKYGS